MAYLSSNEDWFYGLPVAVGLSCIIAKHHLLISELHDIFGQQRDLAATARRVDDEVGNGQPRRPAA